MQILTISLDRKREKLRERGGLNNLKKKKKKRNLYEYHKYKYY